MERALGLLVDLALGIGSNLAWDAIKNRCWPIAAQDRSRRRPSDFAWSMPAALLPIVIISLAKHRWVIGPYATGAVIVGAFAGAVVLLWLAQMITVQRRFPVAVVWVLWITALSSPLIVLDDLMPHGIALDCPTGPVPAIAVFGGRVGRGVTEIVAVYGPLGGAKHTRRIPITSDDGAFRASLAVNPSADELWELSASTAGGETSNLCELRAM